MSVMGIFRQLTLPAPPRKLARTTVDGGGDVIPENPAMVGVGLFLMLVARFARHAAAPFTGKPIRPVTDTERLLLCSFGLFAFLLGLVRMIHK